MPLNHIFLGAVAGFFSSLPYCKAQSSAADVLIYGIENEIKDYNISRSVDKNAFALSELQSEALFYQQPDGTFVPELVKSYRREKKRWIFELRESTFSNGKRLGCEDVRAAFEEVRHSNRPGRARLRDIAETRCEQGRLVFLTHDEAPQLIQRAGSIIRIYDVATVKDRMPVGSGPYVIKGKEGKDLVLVPNKYYYKAPAYREIRFRALRDPWLRDLALLSGNVDFLLENFSQARLRALAAKPEIRLYRNPNQMLHYLVLSKDKFSPAQRNKVRDILYREKLVEKFWGEKVEVAQSLFKTSNPPSEYLSTPETAKLPPFQLEVSLVADETQVAFLRELAKALAAHQIELKLRPLEFASYMKRINSKNFDAYLFYVDTGHPQNLEALLHSRGNRLRIADAALDQSFAEVARTENPVAMERLMARIDETVARNVYLIPLYRPYRELLTRKTLKIQPSGSGFWRDLLASSKDNAPDNQYNRPQ